MEEKKREISLVYYNNKNDNKGKASHERKIIPHGQYTHGTLSLMDAHDLGNVNRLHKSK
jgi:hypothetical protein